MKIGILTFHRAHNYGAILQCYALQETLKQLGYDAFVIDYKQESIEKCYRVFNLIEGIKKTIKFWELGNYISRSRKKYIRWKNFKSFRDLHLKLTPSCRQNDIPQNFDIYIIGSDQLWSGCIEKPDKVYLGDFNKSPNSKVIGYAISSNIDYLKKNFTNAQLNKIVQRFDILSLREKAVSNYISEITHRMNVRCDIDPTLLTDKKIWENILRTTSTKEDRKYIVVYQARGYKGNFFHLNPIGKEFAKRLNYNVIDLTETIYPIEDFIYYIKNAECIITSSFHAVVFSIIFNKPLYAYCYGDKGDERYVNLLNLVGLKNQLVNSNFYPKEIPTLDYKKTNYLLNNLQENSMQYLKSLQNIYINQLRTNKT